MCCLLVLLRLQCTAHARIPPVLVRNAPLPLRWPDLGALVYMGTPASCVKKGSGAKNPYAKWPSVKDHLKYPDYVASGCMDECQRQQLQKCKQRRPPPTRSPSPKPSPSPLPTPAPQPKPKRVRFCCMSSAEVVSPDTICLHVPVICLLRFQWENQLEYYPPCGCVTSDGWWG